MALLVATAVCFAAAGPSTITKESIDIIESRVLPGNILPGFLFSQGSVEGGATHVFIGGGRGTFRPFTPDDTNGPEIFEGAMADTRSPQLPYLTQDQWTCDRQPEKLPVVRMENEYLRTDVVPSVAGKVWNTVDKVNGRDMFFDNKAHQPANIGALKAWAAGGLEFNWSPGIIGHSAFSESPVYVAQMSTRMGPMVRVYEFDRYNGTVWQVDMIHDGAELWMHPKITNPHQWDLRGYWWTCVAHHVTPESRVLSPADHVAETASGPVRDAPWPYFAEVMNTSFSGLAPPLGNNVWAQDHSFLGNIIWGDYFLRIPDGQRRYITHVEADGYFVWHGHTLNGTKFFTWGQTGPGRFMQDFLSAGVMPNRTGDYAELQTGPAPTQMQNWRLAADSVFEWTEVFKAGTTADVSAAVSQNRDHDVAIGGINRWMEGKNGVTAAKMTEMHKFFQEYSMVDPEDKDILYEGMPWGGLNELYRKTVGHARARLAPGAKFTLIENDESRPWIELLTNNTFSALTLASLPQSYQVDEDWRALIEKSAKTKGYTWLHSFYLGVIAAEVGMVDEPIAYFRHSLEQRPTAHATRCIALLQSDPEKAYQYFIQGWELALAQHATDPLAARLFLNLGTEISQFLQSSEVGTVQRLEAWINSVDAGYKSGRIPQSCHLRNSDQFLTTVVKYHLMSKRPDPAISILAKGCFPTYGRARKELISYWQEAHFMKKIAEVGGRPLTLLEKRNVRLDYKPPRNIGCPYADTYCPHYW